MTLHPDRQPVIRCDENLYSHFLMREVALTILLPPECDGSRSCRLIVFNDGQDFEGVRMQETLSAMRAEGYLADTLVVGIHAGHARIFEYGTAAQADYAGRGNKAAETTEFVIRELLPHLAAAYRVQLNDIVYAGFSLGGLMALDIAWNNPEHFSMTGIFSGALWWRQKALGDGYDDSDRIMHAQIRHAATTPALQFWFQCGSLDETDDRDQDGVIDSIQDTLEFIAELERKGYRWNEDIYYTEVQGGRHDLPTWAGVLPAFLRWAAPRSEVRA